MPKSQTSNQMTKPHIHYEIVVVLIVLAAIIIYLALLVVSNSAQVQNTTCYFV